MSSFDGGRDRDLEGLSPLSRTVIDWSRRHPVEVIGGLVFGFTLIGVLLGAAIGFAAR